MNFLVEFWITKSGKDDSREDAKHEAKLGGSEQLAEGSNSEYGLQDGKQYETNLSARLSKFRFVRCMLLTAIYLLVSVPGFVICLTVDPQGLKDGRVTHGE